jgi:hypothetical protein
MSHFQIMYLKWPLGIGDLLLGTKNKTIFIGIYVLECLFLWYLSDLVLWLSVMNCGVISTIASAYAYRKNMLIKITRQTRLSLIKVSSLTISISSWMNYRKPKNEMSFVLLVWSSIGYFKWIDNHQLGTKWLAKFVVAFFFYCATCQH